MITYKMIPSSVAALVHVQQSTDVLLPRACIFMSKETGVRYECTGPLPEVVRDSINAYFRKVFDLEHENWKGSGPSPRAVFVDSAKPWTITIEEST